MLRLGLKYTLFLALFLICYSCIVTEFARSPKGNGISQSKGTVGKGQLVNGRRFPFRGDNYRYFSRMSFTFFNRAWVHEKVLDISLAAYGEMERQLPTQDFLIMECSHKEGGRMWPHRTHQNGTSIDFGTPLLKNGKPYYLHHHFGVWHYMMAFDKYGISNANSNISIDFETMGKHILALDKTARQRGMYIKKVIFKIDLKDDFFASKSGKKVKKKGIYFAQRLPEQIDNLHDEHYHIDFGFLK